MLKRLTLQRFFSVPSGAVEFDNPTFLVGRNGSGKSNLADAIAFLSEAMALPLQAIFERRGGVSAVAHRSTAEGCPANLGLRVAIGTAEFDATYAFEVQATKPHGFEVLREQCVVRPKSGGENWFDRDTYGFSMSDPSLRPALEPGALALPLVGGDKRFSGVFRFLSRMRICRIEPASLREEQDPDAGNRLRPTGRNAASVLREIERESPGDWETLLALLRAIVPATESVRSRQQGNKRILEFAQDWGLEEPVHFPAYNISDGTLRALGVLAAVFQRPVPSVLVIEEPEATIHPGALGAILDLLLHASRRMQVVVTTHSPDLLDAKWIEDRHLRLVTWKEGVTRAGKLSQSASGCLRDHLMGAGELLRANALTSEPTVEEGGVRSSLFDGPPRSLNFLP